ncbi:MAG: RluA family pseudouridine synthase [Sulfurospirillum sp.]|nr:RluA family pseudouridine synthase [Sulfurospirillum sp.]MBL0703348.1 RluA family pseudouridine synthase [Sulfurospirillum sp.]
MTFICKETGRLDVVMSKNLKLPRNQIEQLIKRVGIKIGTKKIKKCSFKLKINDVVEYDFIQITKEKKRYKVDFDIDILYEDDDILIINKPPFLTVHPASSVKEATVVDWLIKRGVSLATISGDERHGIVHRIDKETSGALVVAKNNRAHLGLSSQLLDKSMGRYYLAITDLPLKNDTIVNKPIARNRKNRLKMDVVMGGRESKSAFCKLVLSKDKKKELISAKLFTGRTHQIRVHLSSMSRHILGDTLYGFKCQKSSIARVMLHAYILYLRHPRTGESMRVTAPLFVDFENILEKYFNKDEIDEKMDSLCIIDSFNNFY